MARPLKCPFCGATDSVSKGVRKTKTMGIRRIRLCKACGKKFTPKNQKAGQSQDQEAREQDVARDQEQEERVEPGGEPQEDAEAPAEPEAPGENETSTEPAEALARVFPPPDEQWTS